jgi:adenylate cyclase
VIFAEPDRTSPARYAAEVERHAGSDGDAVRALLAHLPDHDEILAASLKASPSILAFALADKPTGRRPALKSGMAHLGHDPAGILPPARGAVPPIGILEAAAAGVGGIGERNATGVIRRVPLLYAVDGAVHPSLVVEALRVAQGAGSTRVRTTGASGEALGDTGRPALVDLKVGDARVPLTADGQMWIRYDRDRPERFVSVRDILDPDKEADVRPRIEGQVVFVGASVAGLLDLRTTALGEKVAGVSVHAQAVEQISPGTSSPVPTGASPWRRWRRCSSGRWWPPCSSCSARSSPWRRACSRRPARSGPPGRPSPTRAFSSIPSTRRWPRSPCTSW